MSAKFILEGSGAGAVDLIRKLNKELDGTEDQFDKAARGAGRAEAAAKRLVDNVATPMERYKDKVDKLAEAVEKGYISQDKAKVAADRYYAILQKTDPKLVEAAKRQEDHKRAADKSAEAQKKLASEVAKAGEAQRAMGEKIKQSVETPMERYKRQLLEVGKLLRSGAIEQETFVRKARELKGEMEKAAGGVQKVGDATKETFGGKMVASIASYGAGMLSVGAIIGGVKKGLTELENQAQATADRLMGSLGSVGELQQVSATPEEFLSNVAYARSLVRRGVVSADNQSQAFDIATDFAGSDFTDREKELMARVGASGFVKAEGLIGLGSAMRKTQTGFGGEERAGDLERVLNKVVTAGNIAQGADPTQTAEAMTSMVSPAMALGLTQDEAWGALTTAANVRKNITVGSTQIGRFLSTVEQRELGGGDLNEILDRVEGKIARGKTAFDVLGSDNAVQGFRILSDYRGMLNDNIAKMAASEGTFDRQSGFLDLDPQYAAADLRKKAENRFAMAMEERHAERENLFNAMVADIKVRSGVNSFTAYDMYWTSKFIDWTGEEDKFMRSQLNRDESEGFSRMSPEMRSRVEDYLERQATAAEQSAASLKSLESRRGPATTRQE